MTASQLDLGTEPKAKKPSAAAEMCLCGCFTDRHVNETGGCTVHLACTKFRPRVKKPVEQPPHLMPPPGALLLERDDLKRDKRMGWAIDNMRAIERKVVPAAGRSLLMYLCQLKTKSLNQGAALGFMTQAQRLRFFASRTAYIKSLRDRSCSAIAQAAPYFAVRLDTPSRVILTRVCSGKLDDDNLVGAFKPVRDGVADALGIDDRVFVISNVVGQPAQASSGHIPLQYRQEAPGKRKCCGVRIEILWEGAS